mmetsp:Transcript_13656/g.13204  ORF Transcript_13656/g.13204 Transcript_13656/m.13204 type:complete len:296 (+) Transcript_13656:8-895(+)
MICLFITYTQDIPALQKGARNCDFNEPCSQALVKMTKMFDAISAFLAVWLMLTAAEEGLEQRVSKDNIALVSGYWQVNNKFSHNHYDRWFNNTLKINQTTFFFCENQEAVDYIKSFRKDLSTVYTVYPIKMFNSNKFYKSNWVHSVHVPSPELGKIWHEKIHLLKVVKNMDIQARQFYIWCDAGISVLRDKAPPNVRLNLKNIDSLPHNKLCYSDPGASDNNFSGGVLIIHRDLIDEMYDLYMNHVVKCAQKFNDYRCGVDQVIFSEIMKDRPDIFLKIAHGWGMNLMKLYEKHV